MLAFLPPANEILGKVMFFTRVCHSVHWDGVGFLACITGYMNSMQGGGLHPGGLHPRESAFGGSISRGSAYGGSAYRGDGQTPCRN